MPETYQDEEYRAWIRGQLCVLHGERTEDGDQHECAGTTIAACHLFPRATHPDHGNLYPGCIVAHAREHQQGWREIWRVWGICLPEVCIRLYHRFLETEGRI